MNIAARLADPIIQNRLARIAGRFGEDAADVRQQMTLTLIERAAAEPTFAEQKLGYLVKAASWNAKHFGRDARVYSRYVQPEPCCTDDDGEMISALDELWPAPGLNPEQTIIQREQLTELGAQIGALSPKQKNVALMLAAGYEPSEIADRLGMSRSSVSHLARRMRQALTDL